MLSNDGKSRALVIFVAGRCSRSRRDALSTGCYWILSRLFPSPQQSWRWIFACFACSAV